MTFRLKRAFVGTLLGTLILPAHAAYEVKKGDSLSQIAKDHYGNFDKWHEIFDANKPSIKNPNLIYPGDRLRLLDEAATTLPESTLPVEKSSQKFASNGETPIRSIPKKRSQEWRILPTQNWERFNFKNSEVVDATGFDRRSKVAVRTSDRADANITIESDRIGISGEIVSARSDFARLFVGETVLVHADETLEVGAIYSITPGPEKLVSKRDGRVGFGYQINGKIRIIGVREGLFIGTLISLSNPVLRHQLLIPEVSPLIFPEPVAADQPMLATVMVPEAEQNDMLGQQKIVFLDVGAQDGIKPGMVFRQFVHNDPYTGETISSKDFMIHSEVQVLKVQDKFSVAIIINTLTNMKYGDEVIALTDLKDFSNHNGLQSVIQDRGKINGVDDLDKMDINDGLGEKENKDLRQLEKWNKPSPEVGPTIQDSDAEEIKKINVHGTSKNGSEVGKETAPNDGSDKPNTAPEESAAPQPESTPAPSTDAPPPPPGPESVAPPLMGDDKMDLREEKKEEKKAAPTQEAKPEPTPADIPAAPATEAPSGADPFASPAP